MKNSPIQLIGWSHRAAVLYHRNIRRLWSSGRIAVDRLAVGLAAYLYRTASPVTVVQKSR